ESLAFASGETLRFIRLLSSTAARGMRSLLRTQVRLQSVQFKDRLRLPLPERPHMRQRRLPERLEVVPAFERGDDPFGSAVEPAFNRKKIMRIDSVNSSTKSA